MDIKGEYINGKSLNYLSNKHKINKSTLYYRLNKIGIIRRHNIIKKLKTKDELLIGLFIGLWAGDGSKFMDNGNYIIKIHLHKENIYEIRLIKRLLLNLFNKRCKLCLDGGNRASIKISSKFIYQFLNKYLNYEKGNKTKTVSLKENTKDYSKRFKEGYLLGLTISDGCIKNRFHHNSISKNLIENLGDILKEYKIRYNSYIHRRDKYRWQDLHQIYTNKYETEKIKSILNKSLYKIGENQTIEFFKLA